MKKSGTVVEVLSSLNVPELTAFSSGLPLERWWPRVAGGIFMCFLPPCALADEVVLVVVVEVLTEEVPSEPERLGREAVVELEVVLDVELEVVRVVVVVTGATVIVVEVVGAALVVLELVVLELVVLEEVDVLDVEVEVVVVVDPQLSDSVTRERSSAAA